MSSYMMSLLDDIKSGRPTHVLLNPSKVKATTFPPTIQAIRNPTADAKLLTTAPPKPQTAEADAPDDAKIDVADYMHRLQHRHIVAVKKRLVPNPEYARYMEEEAAGGGNKRKTDSEDTVLQTRKDRVLATCNTGGKVVGTTEPDPTLDGDDGAQEKPEGDSEVSVARKRRMVG
jgi:hypothetical protein